MERLNKARMPHYSYLITPRCQDAGGGWRLQLLENGIEVGGGPFPVNEGVTDDQAYFDATGKGDEWLMSKAKPGYLTAKQIAAGAAVPCEHGQTIGRNVAIDVFDAINAAGNDALVTEGGAAAVRALLLELMTFDAKLVDGGYLTRRAAAILTQLQKAGAA